MKCTFLVLFMLVVISCSESSRTNKALEKEADICMKGAMEEAEHWLTDFNKNGYALFLDQQLPSPFDKILFESMDSIKKLDELQKWINKVEQEYGKVKEREFLGIHLTIKGKLLTYMANGKQGFTQISPEKLGLHDVSQLYLKNIEGTYAYLMYESKPTHKDRAAELIVFWLDKNNKWSYLTYKIADDI